MSSTRQYLLLTTLLGLTALVGWWALRPLSRPDLGVPTSPITPLNPSGETPPPTSTHRLAALDTLPFTVPLWVAPPPPPPAPPIPAPPPPPLPLRVQLIAIVRDTMASNKPGGLSVLFYDLDADRLLTLREGDAIGGRTISQIGPESVELKEVHGVTRLSLTDSPGTGQGNGK